MLTSCIQHPPRHPLIIIREWQVHFCDGDKCAAALMSFFEYWHNIKLEQATKASQANDIAEQHGDNRTQDDSLVQFHTTEELKNGIMGLYSDTKIRNSLQFLEDSGVITTMRNPNPRYAFDQTKHFVFHPEICNEYIEINYSRSSFHSLKVTNASVKNDEFPIESEADDNESSDNAGSFHPLKVTDASVKNNGRAVKNNGRAVKNNGRENGIQSDGDNLEAIVDNSQTTTETTTEKTRKFSKEISAFPLERPKEGSKPTLTTPVVPRADPGESETSGEGNVSDKLHFTRAIATYFNHLRESHPDKISQGLTVPRQDSTLRKHNGKNQYTTILKWYEEGKTVEEVCHALTTWVTNLKKPIGSVNYFEKAIFPLIEKPREKLNDEDRRSQMQKLRQQLEAADE